jgi:uncharacterized protein (UPF0128 family)
MKNIKKINRNDIEGMGLNSGILSSTIEINDQHHELAQFLKEMDVNLSLDKIPAKTLLNLKIYYESLNSVLNTYILEHPLNKEMTKQDLCLHWTILLN